MSVVSIDAEGNTKESRFKKIKRNKKLSLGLISLDCHFKETNALILLHLTAKGFTNHVCKKPLKDAQQRLHICTQCHNSTFACNWAALPPIPPFFFRPSSAVFTGEIKKGDLQKFSSPIYVI
jgi:hypothetical protein